MVSMTVNTVCQIITKVTAVPIIKKTVETRRTESRSQN
jgi:hypothetical protein